MVIGTRAPPREFKGPGQDIKVGPSHNVVTALIEYLTVLLEYIGLIGQWGPGQNALVAPPPPLSAALIGA